MVVQYWQIRQQSDKDYDFESLYGQYDNLFSFVIHHGGKFKNYPGRRYLNGKVNYVDLVDIDAFSIIELGYMMQELGYPGNDIMYYYYLVPELSLDYGLKPLGNDADVVSLMKHVGKCKFMSVYIEHGETVLDIYFTSPSSSKVRIEEITDEGSVKAKHGKRLMLEWGKDDDTTVTEELTVNDHINVSEQSSVIDQTPVTKEPIVNDPTLTSGATETNVGDATETNVGDGTCFYDEFSSMFDEDFDPFFNCGIGNYTNEVVDPTCGLDKGQSIDLDAEAATLQTELQDDSDDGDYMVDEDNHVDEVDVDMRDFKLNIDEGVEFMGSKEQINEDVPDMELEVIDNDRFDSGSDSEVGKKDHIRRKKIKAAQLVGRSTNEGVTQTFFFVSQTFGSRNQVRDSIKRHAIETRRQLKIVKLDNVRVRAVCEGSIPTFDKDSQSQIGNSQASGPVKKGIKGKAPASQESQGKHGGGRGKKGKNHTYMCPWVIHVSKLHDSETWMVKTLNEEHRCLKSRNIKACTSSYLASEIAEQVSSNPTVPVKAIQEQLQRKLEIGVSKMKAFRAKAQATKQVKGDFKSQYLLLRDYCLELQSQNDESTIKIEVETDFEDGDDRIFKRIYICLGALKNGFKALGRDMLGLDGAFMKGPYPGILLTAVGMDSNNGIYPVAYAIVESETFSSWKWFLQCLGDDLDLERRSNFTFLSDRQKGILPAIAKVYPCAEHRYCVRHIHENMKIQWKGTAYKDLLWKCATSTTVQQFNNAMEELKTLNEGAYKWLAQIPPHHWARSHFTGRAKSDVLLNNLCEVFNRQLVDARDKPIITCLEYCREYLMKRIVNVLLVIEKCDGPLTPHATKLFEKVKTEAGKYNVLWNGGHKYQVSGPWGDQCVVDINDRSCSCRRWEITGMPCKHAVATIWNMALNGQQVGLPETFVDPVYRLDTWKKMYTYKINPINGKSMWPKSRIPTSILPPYHHTPIGRPKKQRRKTAGEIEEIVAAGKLSRKYKSVKCGKCGGEGHNSRGCRGQGGSTTQEGSCSQGGNGKSQVGSSTQGGKASSQGSKKSVAGSSKRQGVESVTVNNKKKRG